MKIKAGVPFKMGNHIYALCPGCGSVIKLSGFFKGVHLCG